MFIHCSFAGEHDEQDEQRISEEMYGNATSAGRKTSTSSLTKLRKSSSGHSQEENWPVNGKVPDSGSSNTKPKSPSSPVEKQVDKSASSPSPSPSHPVYEKRKKKRRAPSPPRQSGQQQKSGSLNPFGSGDEEEENTESPQVKFVYIARSDYIFISIALKKQLMLISKIV